MSTLAPVGSAKGQADHRWYISVAPKQQSSWLHELPGDLDSGLSPRPSFWKWIQKSFLQVGRQGATSALSEISVLHFPTFQFRIEEKGKKMYTEDSFCFVHSLQQQTSIAPSEKHVIFQNMSQNTKT